MLNEPGGRGTPWQPDGQAVAEPWRAEPELATLTHDQFSAAGWISERKLDGERCPGFAG